MFILTMILITKLISIDNGLDVDNDNDACIGVDNGVDNDDIDSDRIVDNGLD